MGDEVEVLCGLRNSGDEALSISFMTGSLNNPYNFGDYLTNFSEVTVNRTIAPHSEISLDYKFDLPGAFCHLESGNQRAVSASSNLLLLVCGTIFVPDAD